MRVYTLDMFMYIYIYTHYVYMCEIVYMSVWG